MLSEKRFSETKLEHDAADVSHVTRFVKKNSFVNIKGVLNVDEPTVVMKYETDPPKNICVSVVEAVSIAENKSPNSLPPLYYAIEPEVLEKLFEKSKSEPHGRFCQLTFVFSESLVTVEYDENITVEPIPADAIIFQEHDKDE